MAWRYRTDDLSAEEHFPTVSSIGTDLLITWMCTQGTAVVATITVGREDTMMVSLSGVVL